MRRIYKFDGLNEGERRPATQRGAVRQESTGMVPPCSPFPVNATN